MRTLFAFLSLASLISVTAPAAGDLPTITDEPFDYGIKEATLARYRRECNAPEEILSKLEDDVAQQVQIAAKITLDPGTKYLVVRLYSGADFYYTLSRKPQIHTYVARLRFTDDSARMFRAAVSLDAAEVETFWGKVANMYPAWARGENVDEGNPTSIDITLGSFAKPLIRSVRPLLEDYGVVEKSRSQASFAAGKQILFRFTNPADSAFSMTDFRIEPSPEKLKGFTFRAKAFARKRPQDKD